ncbi:hypothetical protein PGT21_033118 [Puccinia graminis f. sp. tritici]|uniref:Uncharacterized protein n=1 Tax=Puccinia graminis f. sp. tritici TaxID=56615 RepID=A0A5B0LLK7_PUCGR|nr:hypothetical protein PGTUg99_009598 [Puccinia graminis f. sp. tritici]KAA1094940.1 hypothetical protein PGT21_033118 [Puccinia graminis f. sp. tritici]
MKKVNGKFESGSRDGEEASLAAPALQARRKLIKCLSEAAGGNLGWVVDRHTIRVRLSIICGVLSGQLQAVGILHHVEGLSDSQFILQVEFQYSVTTLATCLVLLGMSEGIPFARAELRVLRFDQVVES